MTRNNTTITIVSLVIAILFSLPGVVFASKTSSSINLYTYQSSPFCKEGGGHSRDTYFSSMMYEAAMYRGAEIPDGSTVYPGEVITVSPIFNNSNIQWYSTGSWFDSPYGHWVAGAGLAGVDLNDNQACFTIDGDVYFGVSVNPPTPTLSASGPCTVSGLSCTVTGSGPITLTLNFPSTAYSLFSGDDYGTFLAHADTAPTASISFSLVGTPPSVNVNFSMIESLKSKYLDNAYAFLKSIFLEKVFALKS